MKLKISLNIIIPELAYVRDLRPVCGDKVNVHYKIYFCISKFSHNFVNVLRNTNYHFFYLYEKHSSVVMILERMDVFKFCLWHASDTSEDREKNDIL